MMKPKIKAGDLSRIPRQALIAALRRSGVGRHERLSSKNTFAVVLRAQLRAIELPPNEAAAFLQIIECEHSLFKQTHRSHKRVDL